MREVDELATFMCRMSWKSGSLNLLEPSGPHRACFLYLFKSQSARPYDTVAKEKLIREEGEMKSAESVFRGLC